MLKNLLKTVLTVIVLAVMCYGFVSVFSSMTKTYAEKGQGMGMTMPKQAIEGAEKANKAITDGAKAVPQYKYETNIMLVVVAVLIIIILFIAWMIVNVVMHKKD